MSALRAQLERLLEQWLKSQKQRGRKSELGALTLALDDIDELREASPLLIPGLARLPEYVS